MTGVSVEKTTSENGRIILWACRTPPVVSLQEDAPSSSHIDPPLQVKTLSYELVVQAGDAGVRTTDPPVRFD